jgi:YfiH family protein
MTGTDPGSTLDPAAHCIRPEWPVAHRVRALVTTRAGGRSEGAYASLNLGTGTGDDEARVRDNRRRLRALLPGEPRWLRQVHGREVVRAETVDEPCAADASWSAAPGVVCAVLVADCLPVLLAERRGRVVAAAHAGWRGLAAGVLENTVTALGAAGVAPRDLIAWLGPAIGPDAFEVGGEVLEAFCCVDGSARAAFRPGRGPSGRWLADLYALGRQRLARAGVHEVRGGGLCTASDPARFYSYRRDRATGRMAALIWIDRDA